MYHTKSKHLPVRRFALQQEANAVTQQFHTRTLENSQQT